MSAASLSTLALALGVVRALVWVLLTIVIGCVMTLVMFVGYPVMKLIDPTLYWYQRLLCFGAEINLRMFTRITILGLENIPAGKVVFASNHQSFVDPSLIACALPLAHFKCLFKYSLMYVPGVGSTLWFSGHIPVKRDDKTSTKGSLSRAKDALGNGQPVVFFVEGTRVTKQTLGDFKLGAFIAAKEKQAPIVPITISGARALMPPSSLPRMLWGDVVITIHPPVPPPALDAELTPTIDAVRGIIASALRPIDEVTPATSTGGVAADTAAVSDKAKKP